MNQKTSYKIVLLSVFLTLVISIFFGRWMTAKISTLPVLNKWKLLSPEAPIVINNRQEIRVTDSADVIRIINDTRPKINGVLVRGPNQTATLAGGGINLTSDGLFLTTKQVLGNNKLENLFIKLDDGTVKPVQSASSDPVTDLVILKAAFSGVPVANIGNSASLTAGQQVILLAQGLAVNSVDFKNSFISSSQQTNPSLVQDSDFPKRTFAIQAINLLPGQSVVNQNGEIVGLWNGSVVIPADVIKNFVARFLNTSGKSFTPSFGFHYELVSPIDVAVSNLPYGAKVTSLAVAGPAQKAGMVVGDIITNVGGKQLSQTTTLEELLQNYQPNTTFELTVQRAKQTIKLNLTAGEIK